MTFSLNKFLSNDTKSFLETYFERFSTIIYLIKIPVYLHAESNILIPSLYYVVRLDRVCLCFTLHTCILSLVCDDFSISMVGVSRNFFHHRPFLLCLPSLTR